MTPAFATGDSELGGLAVAAAGDVVIGVSFGNRSVQAAETALRRKLDQYWPLPSDAAQASDDDFDLAEEVLDLLQRFAAGEPVDLKKVPIAVDHLSPFQQKVVKACRAIKRGATLSYGEVAAQAGSSGAARAVGSVMRSNRTPLIVPCHRVVAAGGRIGGFSAPDGLVMKRRLLELEADVQFR
ncbi:methylated-DNA--[protein]-cysteine S-methyltransferase [Lacipirellula parvula]|uniref:methylated-DNA--[protein]-cysteine S-methyltransferase n=1 Tax=Lacipirellula parvula TaxID=2650471 RepID=UPI001561E87D|nr:methylated-DNA--[protein]-cysteine S-methyltransferase [Lacipirellula parvula]